MANYKWGEEEPKKKVLDHAKISADLKAMLKFQIFALVGLLIIMAGLIFMIIEWEGVEFYSVGVVCLIAAIFAFFLYIVISSYVKIAKRKYVVEIDTVISIERNVMSRTVNGHRLEDFVRFRNNGVYPIHQFNRDLLKSTEVGDTFYVVRYEKKFGKQMPEEIYSTKIYEWKE